MANNHSNLTSLFTDIADAIRSKTGGSDPIVADQFPEAIEGIESGGGSDDWVIGDGNAHIWVTVLDGFTENQLRLCITRDKVVTIDWGDGTEPEDVSFTSSAYDNGTVLALHNFENPGDYIISLSSTSSTGYFGLSGNSSYGASFFAPPNSGDNFTRSLVKKIETGVQMHLGKNGATTMSRLPLLTDLSINSEANQIGTSMFINCVSLRRVVIPEGISIFSDYVFSGCSSLNSVVLPESLTSIGKGCFNACNALEEINIPSKLTNFPNDTFQNCWTLQHIEIPSGVMSIGSRCFSNCFSLLVVDFSNHSAVPTLGATDCFNNTPPMMQIRVPMALVDEWKAATNWSTYADYIVGV